MTASLAQAHVFTKGGDEFTNRCSTKTAQYAKTLQLDAVTMAVFIPVEDATVLEKLSGEYKIHGVRVIVAAIGWV